METEGSPSYSQSPVLTSSTPDSAGSAGPEVGGLHQRRLSPLSQAGLWVCTAWREDLSVGHISHPGSRDPPWTPLMRWHLPSRSPFLRQNPGRPREPGERVPLRERGGGLRGGMASGGGSLGLITCLLLLQSELCEAWEAATVSSTSDFSAGHSETPRVNPLPPTQVLVTKAARQGQTSAFKPFALGNL